MFKRFLEIYNEKVRDLLGSEETGASCGNFSLRVREHPKLGPYVQGLSEHWVEEKGELLHLLSTGNTRRSTAATESNVHSSRSHAVFTIHLKQSDGENYETEKFSKVHLVDLAGSERARASQSKARLQEGANINKSLATLGNVICALADSSDLGNLAKEASASKTWQPFVPYRDSVLTWLLKDTLGGNSNTIMIATISPASSCLSETVNTLRYAKRAKKIVNQPIVNEDPKVGTIRELRREIARLKSLLGLFRARDGAVGPWQPAVGEATGTPRGESKWPEPEGTQITIEEAVSWKEENSGARSAEEDEGEEASGGSAPSREGAGTRGAGGALSGVDACEIGDEKKSDVNGSVNDNFSHETQFFSDSLESFSSLFLKSRNTFDADDEDGPGDDEFEKGARIQSLNMRRNSNENLSKKAAPEMLHRSRPDLIKGISTRTQENGLPLGSSHSCTDISNLSHSTSENSLNSSGSVEVQPAENRNSRTYNAAEKREKGAGKNGARSEASHAAPKKTEKRQEVVEAVTSRLYAVKKKPDRKTELAKKEDHDDDCGEVDELKLCKRARMKLFDLSRKLAMSRKMKKTVDSDTQTDSVTGTLRVKEKCVTTDPSGASVFEGLTSEDGAKEDKKPYVIMNQVFIPRASNYVVECGEVVRVEAPEVPARHESATQTSGTDKRYKNADTSPMELTPSDEDCFSEDSLDLEEKSVGRQEVFSAGDQGKARDKPRRTPVFQVHVPRDFERRLTGQSTTQESGKSGEPRDVVFNGLIFPVFTEDRTNSCERVGFFLTQPPNNVPVSSENSFTSTEGTDNLSETSSEDFVFYENPKDLLNKSKGNSDRELYTITENSEQSDPGDAFSPVQLQRSTFTVPQETQEWIDNQMRRSQGSIPRNDGVKEGLGTVEAESGKFRSNQPNRGNPDEVLRHLQQVFSSRQTTPDSQKEPTSRLPPPNVTDSKTSRRPLYRFAENLAESEKADVPSYSGNGREKELHRADFQWKPQYLNLNISSSGRAPPFSVDTHLFEKAPRGDQSTDTMSTSADSITFVFMGPAKPKTSVLMEIIGRSLGRSSLAREQPPFSHRKSRSRGVQCDSSLMRSVSVDTAMIALSRIARNQEASPEMHRTTSLGKLDSDDMLRVLGESRLGSSCQCRQEGGHLKEEKKKYLLQYSVGTSTVSETDNTKNKTAEAEKPKKSVSWFGEGVRTRGDGNRDASEDSEFDLEFRSFPEAETEKSNDLKLHSPCAEPEVPSRRVRFLKEDSDLGERRPPEPAGDLTAFLKEATQLLKNINSLSSKQAFSEEAVDEIGAETNRKKDENWRCGIRTSKKKAEGVTKTGFPERDPGWRWKMAAPVTGRRDENQINLTWPRRRATTGKPPTGTKPRFPRPPSLHSSGFSSPRIWSPAGRMGSSGQSWNLSDSSVALGNSCFGDTDSRPSCGNLHGECCSPPVTPSKRANHRPNVDSISDLEADLEEYCRRLELATEQDKARGKFHERKTKAIERRSNDDGFYPGDEDTVTETPREVLNRRKTEGCAGGCVCGTPGREPCRRLWSRGCRSSFELDTFGPGSKHCPQLCMFCRRKEAETYYSAVTLNSECSSGRCRLNYYGFCPCSPVKLNQVVLSPRAYMQRLLALRKQIVSDTKYQLPDRGEVQYTRDFS